MKNIISKGEYKGAPVLGGQNQFEVLDRVAENIDVKGKITPYDYLLYSLFTSNVDSYCDGTFDTVDETIEAFKDDVAANITDGSVIVD